jgi:hypothetical protein
MRRLDLPNALAPGQGSPADRVGSLAALPTDFHRASRERRGSRQWCRVSMATEHFRFRRSCIFFVAISPWSRCAQSTVGPPRDPRDGEEIR